MLNLSDKDIDRLSRDAAEFYEPDDSMLSWNRIEQNLTRQIPERPPDTHSLFRIRPIIWGPAVLLLTGITYFIIKNAAYSKHSTLKVQTGNVTRLPSDHAVKGADGVQNNTKTANSGRADASSGNAVPSPAASEKNSSAERSVSGNNSSMTASVNRSRNNHPNASVSTANDSGVSEANGFAGKKSSSHLLSPSPDKKQRPSGEEPALNSTTGNMLKEVSGSPVDEVSKQNGEERTAHAVHLPALVVSGDPLIVTGNDSSLNRFAVLNSAQKPALSKSLQINHSLTVGVVMGPDYTNAGGMENNQLSNNLGISLGYYLTSRLSLNTGFSYTNKFYWTGGKSFQPQPQYNSSISAYASFPRIESVNGSSDIYEIPLTLRYDLVRIEKTRLFVSAGLSSYLLRKQEYTYFFHNAGRAYEWQNTNDDHLNYWFSVGDFSAGIEHDLGNGFSFQFEPFVRTPFRGIGDGNTKLNSYGMLFSMRYSPVLGRKRK